MKLSGKNKFAGVLLGGTMLAGCVSLTPDHVYPLGATQAIDASLIADLEAPLEATIKTAKSGDIVLQQSVGNASVYVLENSVVPEGDVSLAVQARSVELTEGLKFYPALNVGKETALVACSFDRPAEWVPRLNPGAKGTGKVCFELEKIEGEIDLDNVEENLGDRSSTTFFFVSDTVGVGDQSGPYQKLFRWDQHMTYEVTEPARFKAAEAEGTSGAPDLALRFIATDEGGQLEPVYMSGNQPAETQNDPVMIKAEQEFPVTLEYDGASIEVLALTDGVLAYRILSGFVSGEAYVMDLPG